MECRESRSFKATEDSCNRDKNLLSEGSDMNPGTVTVKELPVTVKESVLYHSSFLPFGDFRYF